MAAMFHTRKATVESFTSATNNGCDYSLKN